MALRWRQPLAAASTASSKYALANSSKFGREILRCRPWCVASNVQSRHKAHAAPAVDYKPRYHDNLDKAKPFEEIPGNKGLPILGNLLELPGQLKVKNLHNLIRGSFEKFGDIYKVKMGPAFQMVWLNDVNEIEKMLRKEVKLPRRIMIPAWRVWRDANNRKRGLLTEDGEDWKRMRVLVDKPMMRPRSVANYTDNFNEVVGDFVDRIRRVRTPENTVPNCNLELFNWSLETIGTVLYETRFGGLSDMPNPEMAEFIQAVRDVFHTTEKVVYFPRWLNMIFVREWQVKHDNGWATVFKTGEKLIKQKFKEMSEKVSRGEEVTGFLSQLLASGTMEEAEVYSNVSELMLGAVDTTSNTVQWVLNCLASHQDVQTKLYNEITSIVPRGTIPSHSDLNKMPYLKAVTKETLRLYPIAPGVSRVLNEDMVLAGYRVPKNVTVHTSTYTTSRNPKYFKNPDDFIPDRWLREDDGERDKVHNFAWLPFGFGPRMCIGRRVSELEMHLLIIRLMQNFRVELAEKEPLEIVTRGLLVPDRSVNVRFIDRP